VPLTLDDALGILAQGEQADIEERCWALAGLGYVGTAEQVPVLLSYLQHADGFLRTNAAWALGLLGAADAETPLSQRLWHEDDEQAAYAFAMTLVCLNTPSAKDTLQEAAQSERESVRRAAGAALVATPYLLPLLKNSKYTVNTVMSKESDE
jgi:HEAT repeat protein